MSDYCPSCGVAYTEHLGLVGTCYRLQEAIKVVGELEAENERLKTQLSGRTYFHSDAEVEALVERLLSQRDEEFVKWDNATNMLIKENTILREALGRLADSSNWFHTSDEKGGPFTAWRGEGEPDILAEQALQRAGGGGEI